MYNKQVKWKLWGEGAFIGLTVSMACDMSRRMQYMGRHSEILGTRRFIISKLLGDKEIEEKCNGALKFTEEMLW